MSKKVLICGDSFGTTQPDRYPGLHFSEKIAEKTNDCEIINLSQGGASNSLIEMQVHQGLQFKPDYAIVVFTNSHRTEYPVSASQFFLDTIKTSLPNTLCDEITNFNRQTYITNVQWNWNHNEISKYDNVHKMIEAYKQKLINESSNLNLIKSYFTILAVLNLLKINNISFCFNLGGIDSNSDPANPYTEYFTLKNKILSEHYLPNELESYMSQSTDINLWDHVTNHNSGPSFHVEDDAIQTAFANDCITKLGLL